MPEWNKGGTTKSRPITEKITWSTRTKQANGQVLRVHFKEIVKLCGGVTQRGLADVIRVAKEVEKTFVAMSNTMLRQKRRDRARVGTTLAFS